jgi:hypothetical protein
MVVVRTTHSEVESLVGGGDIDAGVDQDGLTRVSHCRDLVPGRHQMDRGTVGARARGQRDAGHQKRR